MERENREDAVWNHALSNFISPCSSSYASTVASATAKRQPSPNWSRSTHSFTVWISCCPAPIVTVGTPYCANQLASSRRSRSWSKA
jgi:hypothetical protein